MVTKQPVGTERFVLLYGDAEWAAIHHIGDRQIKEFQHSCRNVHGLNQTAAVLIADAVAGIPQEHGGVHDLVIVRHTALAPPVVFAQHEAVVSAYDQHGVFPQIQLIHHVQHPAHALVAELE